MSLFKNPLTTYFQNLKEERVAESMLTTQMKDLLAAIDAKDLAKTSEIYDQVAAKATPQQLNEALVRAIATDDAAIFTKVLGQQGPNALVDIAEVPDPNYPVVTRKSALNHALDTSCNKVALAIASMKGLDVEAASYSMSSSNIHQGLYMQPLVEYEGNDPESPLRKAEKLGLDDITMQLYKRRQEARHINTLKND